MKTKLIATTAFVLGILLTILWFHIKDHSHFETAPQTTTLNVQPSVPVLNKLEHDACVAHQLHKDACGVYRVSSYDATWTNNLGNEGRFDLERDGLKIRAFCGVVNCYRWVDAVGKSVEADSSITDLITYHDPDCEDPLFVKNAIEQREQVTRHKATAGDICNQTLVVENIEAK